MSGNVPLRALESLIKDCTIVVNDNQELPLTPIEANWFVNDGQTDKLINVYAEIPAQEAQKKAEVKGAQYLAKAGISDTVLDSVYQNPVEETWFERGTAMTLADQVLRLKREGTTTDKARSYQQQEFAKHGNDDSVTPEYKNIRFDAFQEQVEQNPARIIGYRGRLFDKLAETKVGSFFKRLFTRTPVYQQ